ncbi:MAG TPA: tetratricopeptide repeat protein [Candidatus Acidoferrales bacterium]|jgi:serine/threonine-protein kinase|nr:tetratricopeptide repeat protein [Candidatus Acidoferrales bacterium]
MRKRAEGDSFSVESVRAQVERILASETFAHSDRLKRFLRFAVEQVIRGCADQLKEYVVGLEVFDRKQPYDPQADPIVRVEAHRLRSKLKEYYKSEGRKDRLLIHFPKGTYVPIFRIREVKAYDAERVPSQRRSPHDWSTIGVLPFTDLSSEKDQEHFCRGMAEEITNALAHVEGLHVASRTSAFLLSGKYLDVCEVGRKLHVSTVLEGSVRKAGERVRVTVQVANVADGYHLWSETYDREMRDVFAIEDEISRAVVKALKVKLVDQQGSQLVRRRTENLGAYNLYCKGRYYHDMWDLQKSIEYFQQATAEDCNYAAAYAGLAESYSLAAFYGVLPPREVMQAAKVAAMKAVEIDATLGAAHTSLGVIKTVYDWDWFGAKQEFQYALELQPRDANARYWHAHYLESMAWLREAIAEMKLALEIDPLSPVINVNLAMAYYLNGQYSEAIDQSSKAIGLNPRFAGGYWSLGLAYEQRSKYKEAIESLQKATVLSSGSPWMAGALGHCYALSGKRDMARKVLEELETLSRRKYVSPVSMALINIGLGETDQAFLWFEEAYAQRDGRLIYLNVSPTYDILRSDPRFLDLVRRVGLPAQSTRKSPSR